MATQECDLNHLCSRYCDYCFCMSLLCNRTSSYYNRLKQMIEIPLIFLSSIMAIINSTFPTSSVKILNIIMNSITAILINVQSRLRISEISSTCKELAIRFDKLQGDIDKAVSFKKINQDVITSFIKEYDVLINQCPIFPYHIKTTLQKNLSADCETPFILNGYIEKKRMGGMHTIHTVHMSSEIIDVSNTSNIVGRNI